MVADAQFAARLAAGLDQMERAAAGDARKLAGLAAAACEQGLGERAYPIAREARALAPDDPEIASLTAAAITGGAPDWHLSIVRDEGRNGRYEAAIKRLVEPGMRVLDIGAGTGLLAMMAARAGAASVVSCEMNPAVADAARAIVALNGLADRVTVIAKHSGALDVQADLGGQADLLVSEIVSNDMIGEQMLPSITDAAVRLLKPGGAMIPRAGWLRVALAQWDHLERRRVGWISGFDCAPINEIERWPVRIDIGDPRLSMSSAAADLFAWDFAAGGPFPSRREEVALEASAGANGFVQWIRLDLDGVTAYENQPDRGANSAWACLFYPLATPAAAGQTVRLRGTHGEASVRLWAT